MDWGSFGVINNHVESQRVVVMSTKNNIDTVWDEIFNSLIFTVEPPQQYIKKVTVVTISGGTINMSAQDFSSLLEYEKHLPPGVSDIRSVRMSLDFNKIKKDVDKWTSNILDGFDMNGKPGLPKFPKPKAATPKMSKTTKLKMTKPRVTKQKVDAVTDNTQKITKSRTKTKKNDKNSDS